MRRSDGNRLAKFLKIIFHVIALCTNFTSLNSFATRRDSIMCRFPFFQIVFLTTLLPSDCTIFVRFKNDENMVKTGANLIFVQFYTSELLNYQSLYGYS